jgi:hypothetical protein
MENQLNRRNLPDQKWANQTTKVLRQRSKLREQRAAAIDKRWHPEKYEEVNLSSPYKPKPRTLGSKDLLN